MMRLGVLGPKSKALDAPSIKLVCDGDSNTAVTGSWAKVLQARFAARGYPNVSLPEADVLAVAGQIWSHAESRAATAASKATGDFNVYIVMMGTNNFSPAAGYNHSVATTLAQAESCINAIRATGAFDHLVVMEIADHEGFTATVNAINAGLHAFAGPRVTVVPRDASISDNTTFFAESPYRVHFNTALTAIPIGNGIIDLLEKRL